MSGLKPILLGHPHLPSCDAMSTYPEPLIRPDRVTRRRVGVTAVVALLVTWRPAPSALSPTSVHPGTIAVTRQPYDDAREVEVVVARGAAGKLLATTSGVLTSSRCRPGQAVTSGDPVATIDQRPVVPLATAIPPFRAITVGVSGRDVVALRAELTRLKAVPVGTSRSAPADTRLIRAARRLSGLDSAAGSLPTGAFAWMPSSNSTVATCEVPVGARVSAGTPLATLSPPVTNLAISAPSASAAPGPRVLTVASVTVRVIDGRVTAANDLARLVRTAAWATYEQSAGKVPVRGRWKLSRPIQVASLPAASLVTAGPAAGSRSCVSSGGRALPVTVVASSLGRTLVTFTGTWPAAVDPRPSPALRCG
jgi:hypothetical protein